MDPWRDDLSLLDADDFGSIDAGSLTKPFDDEPDVHGAEVDAAKRLADDKGFTRKATARTFEDFRANPDALRHLRRLPKQGESFHGVICGKYALWDLVPAVMERTGRAVERLHVATLSYSQANAAQILAAVDAGRIRHLSLLISHYFKSTSPHLYDALVPQLLQRGHRVLAMRTHCKILLFEMEEGARYVVESSANLRSSSNVEQFVMTRDARLHAFHREWIEGELMGVR